jgi:class 3 adenylate cyclase
MGVGIPTTGSRAPREGYETYQVQHRVEHAGLALEEAGLRRSPATDPPAIVFLDLTGYTALTEQLGDEASVPTRSVQLRVGAPGPTCLYWNALERVFMIGDARPQ